MKKRIAWWSTSSKIPYRNYYFQEIINGFVFECPSTVRAYKTVVKSDGKKQKEIEYNPVSARKTAFRNRGITKNLLTTILANIRRPIMKCNAYAVVKPCDDVEKTVKTIIQQSSLADKDFEIMVYCSRDDMPDTEAIYYYIRNSFAHGSFEVKNCNGKTVYFLQSSKKDKTKAIMRLKEETLLHYIELANLSSSKIKALQKQKKRE